jgi:primosomal replication protein N
MSDHASSMLRLGVSVTLFITACATTAELSSQMGTALELRSQQEEHSEGRINRTLEVSMPERVKGTQVMQAIRMNLQEGISVQVDGTVYDMYSEPFEPDVSALDASSLYSMHPQRDQYGKIKSIRFEKLGED